MLQIFKKLFSPKISSKRTFLACPVPKRRLWFGVFLIFTLFILFCPFSFTNAQWGTIGKALAFLPNLFITILLQITVGVTRVIFEMSNWLLGWAMSNPFKASFTDPAGNPVIRVGWVLLRDIVNMLFILGLAYIGLATALDFGGFNTKKIFGNLLIIALLINFTPVICGVIVDISNILSNFFLRNADFTGIVTPFGMFQGSISDMLGDIFNFVILLKTLILIIYGILGSLIFFLFAFLFLVRGPIIWILVILSPLAFFSWIFPKTKGMIWDKWWNVFLQWSFVVVPASFFLYLSQQVIVKKDELLNISGTDPAGGLFLSLAPYFVALMFMIFGFVITLQINAMGTKSIMTGFKKGTKAMGKKAAERGWQWTKTGAGAVKAGAGAVAAEAGRIQTAYKGGRALGLSKTQAAGQLAKMYWQRRAKPAIIAGVKAAPKAVVKTTWAATKGILSATKDIAVAGVTTGVRAGLGIKPKGFRKCPSCGNQKVAKSAIACPTCGYVFQSSPTA